MSLCSFSFEQSEVSMLARAEKRQPNLPPHRVLMSRNVDVLVVHNEEHIGHFLDFHLWRAGYSVRIARDAIQASALVVESTPDVMILDIDMRGLNGFEFLAGIRADRRIPFFPVIYLTSDRIAAVWAQELGAACVHKPVQPAKLLATVALSSYIHCPRPPASTLSPVRS